MTFRFGAREVHERAHRYPKVLTHRVDEVPMALQRETLDVQANQAPAGRVRVVLVVRQARDERLTVVGMPGLRRARRR